MDWEKAFEPRKEVVLATVKKDSNPYAIYVLSMGIVKNKVVIGVCLMKKTLENIKANDNVILVGKSDSGYYRISGKAKVYSAGEYLQTAISHSRPPMPTQAMTVDIDEVYDLGNVKRIDR